MPNPATWQIVNNGSTPVTITDISTSDMTKDVTSISMQTGDGWQFDDPSNTSGHWSFAYKDGKNFLTKTAGTADNPLVISNGYPIDCMWNVEVTDSAKRSATSEERRIGNVSLSFKAIEKTTFAVYCKEARTLDFYKRLNLPKVGDEFDGKRVDEIFTVDTENGYHQTYQTATTRGINICTPWRELLHKEAPVVDTINVVDRISPKSTSWWFMDCGAKTLNLGNLDMSRCVDAQRMFSTNSITKITGMESWDTSSLENAYAMFDGFVDRMTDISFCKNWNMSKCRNFGAMFFNTCSMRDIDFSNWNCSSYDINATSDDGSRGSSPMFGNTTTYSGSSINIRNINVSQSASRLRPILFNISYENIKNATGKWYSFTDKKAYTKSDIPTDRAASYTIQLNAGTITGTIDGNGVQGYDMVCNATSSNLGTIPLQYRWQKWSGDSTTTWVDINSTVWVAGLSSIVVTDQMGGYTLRCIVKPATGQYVADETTITSDMKCTRSLWTSNTASLVDEGGGKLRVDASGLPDKTTYGKTTTGITWFADVGPTHNAKQDSTLHKSISNAGTAWGGFKGLNQILVIPGQTYRLSYDSVEQTGGESRPIDIQLFEWTKSPESSYIKHLVYVPYSDTAGYVDISVPSDLDMNSWYTIVATPRGFGKLYDYDGIIKGMAIDCITENGFVPIKYSDTSNELDASGYSGHRIMASVLHQNRYYRISRRMTDAISVP